MPAQVAGALAAALLLRASLGDIADVGATLPAGSDAQSFLWEFVLTFFLMFVITSVATDARAVGEAAAIAIGAPCTRLRPVSGASLYLARSIGPAVAAGELQSLWIYVTAPVCGAIAGALAYQFLRSEAATGREPA